MTDAEILRLAGREDCGGCPYEWYHEDVLTFGRAIAAAEREACAEIAGSTDNHSNPMTAWDVADAIRARGKGEG